MQTKLTLRMDEDLIRRGKAFAKESGKSVSRLVEDYFALLDNHEEFDKEELSPLVKSLSGVLKGTGASEEDYYEYLEDKYG